MKLKSLEVQGYKSFASKVEFEFDQGITAVVGPNGSGKSNVADAIRWALGEQSYNLLRGKRTEDMIFSGSSERARLGMASVSLVMDNSDGSLPVDFSEVTITRRAYRSGENEYLLNNSRVRLRDISEMLAKGGLDRQTYTVVGQGTIDRALSLRPDERRQLFEEAAGITFHRQQRATTLKRLEEAQANLLRVNDIITEIEPRMRRLERQAERAAEYEQLKAGLDDLLRTWYGYRWRQGQIALHEARQRAEQAEATLVEQRQRLAAVNEEIEQLRSRQTEARERLARWHADSSHVHAQAETLQRELAVGEERARLLSGQREEILSELAALEANLAEQDARVKEAEAALSGADVELEQARASLKRHQDQVAAYQAQRQALLDRQAEAERNSRRLANELAEREARLQQLAERQTELVTQRQEREGELAQLAEKLGQIQARQAEVQAGTDRVEQTLAALLEETAKTQADLERLQAAAAELEREIGRRDRQIDSLKARQDLLARLRRDLSGYHEGVRAVLKGAEQGRLSGVLGTVSQLLRVPPRLEAALEAAVGGQLQNVVVSGWAAAENAISFLKANNAGRATFLPLDRLRPPGPLSPPDTAGVVGLAAALVEFDAGLEPVVQLLLNRTLITEDLPAARRAFEAMQGGFQIVTLAGELVRSSGAVTGGVARDQNRQDGGFLAREREWRELPEQIAGLEQDRAGLQTKLAAQREEEQRLRRSLQDLDRRQQEARRSLADLNRQLAEIRGVAQGLENALEFRRDLQARAAADLAQLAGRETQTRQEIQGLIRRQGEAEAQVQQFAAQVGQLSAESLLADLGQARTAVAVAEEHRQQHQTILQNHHGGQQQLRQQIAAKRNRAESLAAERDELLGRLDTLREEADVLNEQIAALAARIEPAEVELAALEQQQLERERAEAGLRQQLHRLESEHSRLALEQARRQDGLENLQRQIEDDLGLVELPLSDDQVGQPVLPIHPLVSELPLVEVLPPGVEEDIRRLKVQIQRLGAINPDAPREYNELRERYDFLSNQMHDLEAAIADLRHVIAELDELMETAFDETFQQVAGAFQHYFRALFGGGEAQLTLTNPDNLTETGVEIEARPPGKRLQTLALLSGGERSLTAQALLFALLRTSPTPFVILDEVDAMLDEANVDRFRQALSELARDIQFIIITHNRKTIEAANTIYGISMGDDSVSRVVARKLEEIEEPAPATA